LVIEIDSGRNHAAIGWQQIIDPVAGTVGAFHRRRIFPIGAGIDVVLVPRGEPGTSVSDTVMLYSLGLAPAGSLVMAVPVLPTRCNCPERKRRWFLA